MRIPPNLDAFDSDLLLLKDEGVLKDNDIRLIYALLDNGGLATYEELTSLLEKAVDGAPSRAPRSKSRFGIVSDKESVVAKARRNLDQLSPGDVDDGRPDPAKVFNRHRHRLTYWPYIAYFLDTPSGIQLLPHPPKPSEVSGYALCVVARPRCHDNLQILTKDAFRHVTLGNAPYPLFERDGKSTASFVSRPEVENPVVEFIAREGTTVSLWGMSGIGKSCFGYRVAKQVAEDLALFPDGVVRIVAEFGKPPDAIMRDVLYSLCPFGRGA